MKKLKKQDFKKVAWKGVAAGILLASQASAQQLADVNGYGNMLAAGCATCKSAYRSMSSSCAAKQSSCAAKQTAYNASCAAQSGRQPAQSCAQTAYNMPQNSCAAQQSSYNPPAGSCQAQPTPPATQRPEGKAWYTNNQGKWVEGQPPAEWTTNQPANPNQDQKVDTQYGQPQRQQQPQNSRFTSYNYTADADTAQQGKMTEESLSSQLNPQTRALFERMSPEGKALALKLANQSCKGQNDCKGLGTAANNCAGKNGCKGTSDAPFKDKNAAVTTAAKAMAEKRAKAFNSNY
jgi:hypothetical protein